MLLKEGSRGQEVVELQRALQINVTGVFDENTKAAVLAYQREHGLMVDGIVGSQTLSAIREATITTDISEKVYSPFPGLTVKKNFLPSSEYKSGPTQKEYLFLHHTAGWNNPYKTVQDWATDNRGPVATEFVLGGPSVKGNDDRYDGEMVQCCPEGAYGWHLGDNGSQYMHVHSVGIEVCNFGQLTEGGYRNSNRVWIEKIPGKYYTYSGQQVDDSQIVKLEKPFREHRGWHAYSDKQIEALKLFILWIAERDSIDIRDGLIANIRRNGVNGFDFNEDAYYGRIKGMWTHTNTRKDKFDLFPQPNLIDMLLSL